MDELTLVKPTKTLEQEIKQYCKEYYDYGETRINGSCGITHYKEFDEWLKLVHSIEGETLSREDVHASTYLSIRKSDKKIIGTIQLRHSLSDKLIPYGGHIGYGIRPLERGKGYATIQLRLVLEEAKKLNIPKVMITCDKSNIGSAKAILKNGGILEWDGFYDLAGVDIEVYWILLQDNLS